MKIASVESGGGAAKAGLKAGDVITAFDGTRRHVGTKLRAVIATHAPGDSVTVTYQRGGSSHTVHVTLGTRTELTQPSRPSLVPLCAEPGSRRVVRKVQ